MKDILKHVKEEKPLVHFITNKVTINDCANVTLALGGKPIMADDEREVEEITAGCDALVLNMGTLSQSSIPAMKKALKKANALHHPVILDPVGIGASTLRKELAFELIQEHVDVIKGNASEIKIILGKHQKTQGVDVNEGDQIDEEHMNDEILQIQAMCQKLHTIIVLTGEKDLVIDEHEVYVISNGHPSMSKITGTGCMLSGMIGTFIACHQQRMIEAVAYAVSMMGYCGERAYAKMIEEQRGLGSMHMYLIDEISLFDETKEAGQRIEKRNIDTLFGNR